jgi:hypothetical protein
MPFTKNVKTDYGAVGDGVANDRAAFLAFKAAAAGLDSVLTVPAGTYFIGARASAPDADEDYLFSGIPTLIVEGTGATLTDGGTANDYHLGARHAFYNDGSTQALTQTVSAGSSTVELVTSGDHTQFSVGDWAMMGGFHMMEFGFPINPHFFEFVKVASKQVSTLPYTITFTTPLRNAYKSTWPNWATGFGAGLYRLDQVWDVQHDYRGLTITKTGATRKPTNCVGRAIILNGVTPTNADGINPSSNASHQILNCNYTAVASPGGLEVDKCLESLVISNSTMGSVNFQSTSVDALTASNSTFAGFITGLPKRASFNGCTMAYLGWGAGAFGRADELTCTNCVITDFAVGSWLYKGGNSYLGDDLGVDGGSNSMTNGIIKIPKSYGAKSVSWAVPGTWCAWQDLDRLCVRLFRVVDVTEDGTHSYIETTWPNSWPSYNGAGKLYIRSHPAPRATFRGCSTTAPAGTDDGGLIYGLNSAAEGAPLWSYARRKFNGETNPFVTNEFGSWLWGDLSYVKMTVSPAYTGATNPAKMQPLGWFHRVTLDNQTMTDYVPEINIRTSGLRQISVVNGSEVDSGIQAGDANYTLPQVPPWLANYFFANMMHDIRPDSGSFEMTVEIATGQGISEVQPEPPPAIIIRRHVPHWKKG